MKSNATCAAASAHREAKLHATLDTLAERLDRLEASRSGMKVVAGKTASTSDTLIA
jgi:hypothetical protein